MVCNNKGLIADTRHPEYARRIAVCVSSLAGITDPAAAIQAARDALEKISCGWDRLHENASVQMTRTDMKRIASEALALLTHKP